jgi:hypothetical protein
MPLRRLSLIIALSFFSLAAFADAGVPMLILVWPVFGLALLPIIGIEYVILRKRLADFTSKRLLLAAFVSNITSTVIGIPLTWVCLAGIEMLGLMTVDAIVPGGQIGLAKQLGTFWTYFLNATALAPWLMPYGSHLYWMIPVAFLVLLVPFFYASYWIEAAITVRLLKDKENRLAIRKAVWVGNVCTYSMMAVLDLIFLAFELFKHYH